MTRTVLITGGTSGIGRAVAAAFAAEGAEVLLTGRTPATVEATAAELGVRGLVCDASDPGRVQALADQLPALDVLVNAAGGLPPAATGDEPALAALLAQWEAALAQNLLTAVLTTAAVQDRLRPGGSVVSIGSIGAERRGGSYGAAKAALGAWNASLSAELAPRGITCNVISAGYIAGTNFFQGQLSEERHRALVAETHDKRAGTVEDITATVAFLASPGARHLTGQTLHVNGGAFTTR
ncbi:SDR family NAD(P)-dependent oxidoreductase [Streptomyces physcomitrii]|uniref:SDR family oxidoreductase n=1 Tax=Streptomyces physcomitrii TaxID=2724184 RepID=A0ABX1HBS3_9ACTN|nr:SDR family oxidoreductase [Streptomyces physcomitrii]NKI45513.1 SDR family oxidoreductase [Streptomyces physcomitrii]